VSVCLPASFLVYSPSWGVGELGISLFVSSELAQASASTVSELPTPVGNAISSSPEYQSNDLGAMTVMTRFFLSRLPAALVGRERLLSLLDTALSHPLMLLSASAGWGKTTLLAAWAHRHLQSVAWLSLETLDNDPLRFWVSIIAAYSAAFLQRTHLAGQVALELVAREKVSVVVTDVLPLEQASDAHQRIEQA